MEFSPGHASPADATAAFAAFAVVNYAAGRVSEAVEQVLAGQVADHATDRRAFWEAYRAEGEATKAVLEDLLGNPFRPVNLTPTQRTPTIVSLARSAYDERHLPGGELDAERLAVLADALEDAGAPDELVAHLRGPGPHVRGCFAVDALLGKE